MLSIRFGYGRPAALAEAFAAAFFFGVSFFDLFLGFSLSQTSFLAATNYSPIEAPRRSWP